MRRIIAAVGLAALLVGSVPAHAAAPDIVIAGFQYSPSGHYSVDPLNLTNGAGTVALPVEPLTFSPGRAVTVMNADAELPFPHTLTEISGPPQTSFSVTVDPGKSVTFTLPVKRGTYIYKCMFHVGMRGSFVIA